MNRAPLLLRLFFVAAVCSDSVAYAQQSSWDSYIAAGNAACTQGSNAAAEKPFTQALQEAEKFGRGDERLVSSLTVLALLYTRLHRYSEAESFYKRAVTTREEWYGADNNAVAQSLDLLGRFYSMQGKYGEAEPIFKRAMAIHEKNFGPNHPSVAKDLRDIADVLRKTNRQAEADKLEARAKSMQFGNR